MDIPEVALLVNTIQGIALTYLNMQTGKEWTVVVEIDQWDYQIKASLPSYDYQRSSRSLDIATKSIYETIVRSFVATEELLEDFYHYHPEVFIDRLKGINSRES